MFCKQRRMLDQTFRLHLIKTPTILIPPTNEQYNLNTLKEAAFRFNPFETIVGNTPVSCYETLSIINEFRLFGCNGGSRNPTKFVYLDLDDTEGFSMALQGRFPNSLCYGLANSKTRVKWDFFKSGLEYVNFDLESSSYKSVMSRCIYYNSRGIPLSYLTFGMDEPHIAAKLRAAVNVLSVNGNCIIKLVDYNLIPLEYLRPLVGVFKKLIIYKSAVTSSSEMEANIICLEKYEGQGYDVRLVDGKIPHKIADGLLLLETQRLAAEYSISKFVDNRTCYDVSAAKIDYLGMPA